MFRFDWSDGTLYRRVATHPGGLVVYRPLVRFWVAIRCDFCRRFTLGSLCRTCRAAVAYHAEH